MKFIYQQKLKTNYRFIYQEKPEDSPEENNNKENLNDVIEDIEAFLAEKTKTKKNTPLPDELVQRFIEASKGSKVEDLAKLITDPKIGRGKERVEYVIKRQKFEEAWKKLSEKTDSVKINPELKNQETARIMHEVISGISLDEFNDPAKLEKAIKNTIANERVKEFNQTRADNGEKINPATDIDENGKIKTPTLADKIAEVAKKHKLDSHLLARSAALNFDNFGLDKDGNILSEHHGEIFEKNLESLAKKIKETMKKTDIDPKKAEELKKKLGSNPTQQQINNATDQAVSSYSGDKPRTLWDLIQALLEFANMGIGGRNPNDKTHGTVNAGPNRVRYDQGTARNLDAAYEKLQKIDPKTNELKLSDQWKEKLTAKFGGQIESVTNYLKKFPTKWQGAGAEFLFKLGRIPADNKTIGIANVKGGMALAVYPDGKVHEFPIIIGKNGYSDGARSGDKKSNLRRIQTIVGGKLVGRGQDASKTGSRTVVGAALYSKEEAHTGKWWHGVADNRIAGRRGRTWGCIGAKQEHIQMMARTMLKKGSDGKVQGGYLYHVDSYEGAPNKV